jgi:hypothetical protein
MLKIQSIDHFDQWKPLISKIKCRIKSTGQMLKNQKKTFNAGLDIYTWVLNQGQYV